MCLEQIIEVPIQAVHPHKLVTNGIFQPNLPGLQQKQLPSQLSTNEQPRSCSFMAAGSHGRVAPPTLSKLRLITFSQ
jgi:hypothetical protein